MVVEAAKPPEIRSKTVLRGSPQRSPTSVALTGRHTTSLDYGGYAV
jgi:hypothetical protein